MVFESRNNNETFSFAESLGKRAAAGEVYALTGDLGAGKTVFAQGFARGLGIGSKVNSPTYTILHSYEDGRLPFHHFDVYRLEEPEEMEETGYEDCFYSGGVSLVEWADTIRELLPEDTIWVHIYRDNNKGTDYRRIELEDTCD